MRAGAPIVLLVAMTAGCGHPDCATIADATERDWCHYDAAERHATDGKAPEAVASIRSIQAPMVKAAAIDKVFTLGPRGIGVPEATALCKELPANRAEACLKTWYRPHLWER